MKIIGTTEEITTCDCCGRTELKKTIAFESENRDLFYYGVVCASKIANMSAEKIKQSIKEIESNELVSNMFALAKGDYQKEKALSTAKKKNLNMDLVFLKYGDLMYKTNFESVYCISNITHAIGV